jgi:hypothetical protein
MTIIDLQHLARLQLRALGQSVVPGDDAVIDPEACADLLKKVARPYGILKLPAYDYGSINLISI